MERKMMEKKAMERKVIERKVKEVVGLKQYVGVNIGRINLLCIACD
jgi:hypothetical protein